MASQQIISVILFSTVIAAVSSKIGKAQGASIEQFVNNAKRIWTINSTADDTMLCKLDAKYRTAKNSTIFYRLHLDDITWKWIPENLTGRFTNWYSSPNGPYISMNIRTQEGRPRGYEVIEYQSTDKKCAVFFVMSHRGARLKPSYEIRLKQSSLTMPMDAGCLQKFQELAKGRKVRRFYYEDCPKALTRRRGPIRGVY